jgi:thioredoxin-related protein
MLVKIIFVRKSPMASVTKKLPRPLSMTGAFLYPVMAAIIILVLLFVLAADELSLADWGILILAGALMFLIWWRFHARPSKEVPLNATSFIREAKHSHKYTLIALESEYCPNCMISEPRVKRLEENPPPNLKVYRVTIQREPGRSLFKQFGGRMTPTYVLLDRHGEVVEDWVLALPVERVMYAVGQHQTS